MGLTRVVPNAIGVQPIRFVLPLALRPGAGLAWSGVQPGPAKVEPQAPRPARKRCARPVRLSACGATKVAGRSPYDGPAVVISGAGAANDDAPAPSV